MQGESEAGIELQHQPRRPINGKATLRDVSRLAGVSMATVSRVLNNSGPVGSEKHAAVSQALASLNYVPNHAARSLIYHSSRTIGLIIPTMSTSVFAPTIDAIERRLEQAGYALIINFSQRQPGKELHHAKVMVGRGVDGLILTGSAHHPDLLPLLDQWRIPYVSQDVSEHMPSPSSVALANEAAMAVAVDYLVRWGHRRIAVLAGPQENTPISVDRARGAVERLRHHGCVLPEGWLVTAPSFASKAVRAGMRDILALRPRPTAVACAGDVLALGASAEAHSIGLAIPRDISIIGCGDNEMGEFVFPPLTTVRLPFDDMGTRAAEKLLSLLAGHPHSGLETLPFELIERATVGAPPNEE